MSSLATLGHQFGSKNMNLDFSFSASLAQKGGKLSNIPTSLGHVPQLGLNLKF